MDSLNKTISEWSKIIPGGAFRISDATIIKDNRDKLFKR